MTPLPTQTPALPLDPDTLAALLRTTVDALPLHPGVTAAEATNRRHVATLAIAALRPRDPMEAFLAARIVAMHYHVIENLRCATQPDLPVGLHLRF